MLPVKADSSVTTEEEQEAQDDKIDEWHQKNALAKQHIYSTITNRLLWRVQRLQDASKIWKELCTIQEGEGPSQGEQDGADSKQTAAIADVEEEDAEVEFAFATSDMSELTTPIARHSAVIDSGATSHFCPDRSLFTTYVAIDPIEVKTANGSVCNAIGRGSVRVDLPLGQKNTPVALKDALHTPKMACTLVSTRKITAAGLAVLFEDGECKILTPAPERRVIVQIPQDNGLYRLEVRAPARAEAPAQERAQTAEGHRRARSKGLEEHLQMRAKTEETPQAIAHSVKPRMEHAREARVEVYLQQQDAEEPRARV